MDSDDFIENGERHELIEVVRHQATVKRLQAINVQIQVYEERYHGTFQDLYSHLTDHEIRGLQDVTAWKELVEERKRLIEKLDADDIPEGIYAVPPDPNEPKLKVRKLVNWCREHGIPLSKVHRMPGLIEQFLVYPAKDGEQDKKRV